MCLFSMYPKQIADKNIYTLKFAENYSVRKFCVKSGKTIKRVQAYYQFDFLPIGELLTTNLGVRESFPASYTWNGTIYKTKVDEGYHSLIDIEGFYSSLEINLTNLCIVLCIIPKDSEYYIGSNGDIVSNKIILEEVIYNYKTNVSLDEKVQEYDTLMGALRHSKQICESYGIKIGL